LELRRDGIVVTPSERGAAMPVDPGQHKIEASAPQKKTWTGTINVAEAGATASITIPPLEDVPADTTPRTSPPPAPSLALATPMSAAEPAGLGTQRTVALGLGGLGVAGAAVGTIFAITAKSRYSDSLALCSAADQNACSADGVSRRNDARAAGNVATVAFAVGAAAIAAGAVLWLTAPRARPSDRAAIRVGLAPAPFLAGAGALMQGEWQ
jgi:hypothetical protein